VFGFLGGAIYREPGSHLQERTLRVIAWSRRRISEALIYFATTSYLTLDLQHKVFIAADAPYPLLTLFISPNLF
jgi:hypothetical protein